MSEIIKFPGTIKVIQDQNLQNMLKSTEMLLEEGLKETPEKVKNLLSTPLNKITIITNPDDIRLLIFEYIIQKIQKEKMNFGVDITQATQYLSDLLFRLGIVMDDETRNMLENPYYVYWLDKGEPKKAGDVSVYNLIFGKKSRKKILTKDDYINFAISGYYFYSGENFAFGIKKVLPLIENFTQDNPFFRKNFQLIK